ncbi:MAG: RNA ligase family protein [bacterium]|nr:RNA ligase family protein [bacterium]
MKLERFKYPRTFHVPWSPGSSDDDKRHTEETLNKMFSGKNVIVTEKLDGENTSIYSDGTVHARSIASLHHQSRSYVKSLAGDLGPQLPSGWRLLGENMYAKHSIAYDRLPDYFIIFGIVNELNIALSWHEVKEYSVLLGLPHVTELYNGSWDREKIISLYPFNSSFGLEAEGYVIRDDGSWPMVEFGAHVAKYVRANHVQTNKHWKNQKIVPNKKA